MRREEFRRALDECLERIRGGASVNECLEAHPQLAEGLEPFLRSAATLRELGVPEPSASAMKRARDNLLRRVAEGSGKEAAVVKGIFKYANLAAVAVAAVLVAGMGLVAAAGPGMFGDGENEQSFNASVIAQASTLWYVHDTDGDRYVFVVLSDQTQYRDAEGNAITQADVHVRDRIKLQVTPSSKGPRFFDAQVVVLVHDAQAVDTPKPTEKAATPVPEPSKTAAPEPTDKPATPKPTEKPAPPAPTEKPAAQEFWGAVLAVSETNLTLQTEMGNVTVWVNAETQFPTGFPFVGVKVWVLGTKQADGSYIAQKITVKTVEFIGTVTAAEGGTFHVNSNGVDNIVHTNAETSFPNGVPVVGNTVGVSAYKMADGTYLAKTVIVKAEAFGGIIVEHLPGESTIMVDVAGTLKVVGYGGADVVGTLAVGAKVWVEVDHIEAGTYFARLVKVVG